MLNPMLSPTGVKTCDLHVKNFFALLLVSKPNYINLSDHRSC